MISCVRRSSAATSPKSSSTRPQLNGEPTNVLQSANHRIAKLDEGCTNVVAVGGVLDPLETEQDRSKGLCGFIVKFTCETALLDLLGLDYPSHGFARYPMRKVHRDCGSIGKRLCQPHFGVRESGVVLPPVERHQHADGLARVRSGTQGRLAPRRALPAPGRPLGRRAASRRARWLLLEDATGFRVRSKPVADELGSVVAVPCYELQRLVWAGEENSDERASTSSRSLRATSSSSFLGSTSLAIAAAISFKDSSCRAHSRLDS